MERKRGERENEKKTEREQSLMETYDKNSVTRTTLIY